MSPEEREAMREFIVAVVLAEATKAVGMIDKESLRGPPGKDGADGKDAKDGADGKDGRDGVDGKDGVGLKGLDGTDGKDGRDGIDADPVVIERMITEAVGRIPTPKDGASVTVDDLAPVVASEVQRAVAALPVPKDGKDADPVVIKELVASSVAALPPSRDGKDADPQMITSMVTDLFRTIPMPKDGKDGITIEQLEAATLKALAAALGEMRLEGRNLMIGDKLIKTLAFPEDRGVYQPETDYARGDVVTFGGSGWHCNTPTRDKPGTSDTWRLMIKKGRDGRDATR